jgi:hypothetical protein
MIFFAVMGQTVVGTMGHEWRPGQWWMLVNVVAHGACLVPMFVVTMTTTTVMAFQITFLFIQVVTLMTWMGVTHFPTQLFSNI